MAVRAAETSGRAKVPTLRIAGSIRRSVQLLNKDPLRWFSEAAEMGPIVAMAFGPVTANYIVNDPEAARSIFIANAQSWRRPPVTITPIRLAIGENLFTQSERDWSMLQPSLTPDFRKKALQPRLTEAVELIEDEVATLPYDVEIDFDQAMGRIALMVAAWVLFGERLERDRAEELVSEQRQVISWLDQRINSARAISPLAPGRAARQMRSHRAVVLAYAGELIDARHDQGPRGDVLDALIEARPGGRPLTRDELETHVLGLFGAGNETTAAALCWALVHGAQNPAPWSLLRDDPSSVGLFAAETMRLSPPGWGIPRAPVAGRSKVLRSGAFQVRVRPWQMVTVNLYGMNRDESMWPDATRFDPRRHTQLSKEQDRALLPFGLGLRGCIGQHMALSELHSALPALARHGDVVLDSEPVGHPTFTLRVKGGLRGRFRRIQSAPDSATQSADTGFEGT